MEITTTTINRNPARRAAVNTLAFIGFIALLAIGIGLAIYSARFVPKLASSLGGAAVSLSSVFRPSEDASLEVVTASTTLPIADAVSATTTTATTTVVTTTKPVHTPVGPGTTTYTTVTTSQDPNTRYGNSDLTVVISQVGYLSRSGDTSTFVGSSNVPFGNNGAVKFTVTNRGTNVTGVWKFQATVPSNPTQTFVSPLQNSLNPGDSIDFVLGFDQGSIGANRDITVIVDPFGEITESSEINNTANSKVTIGN